MYDFHKIRKGNLENYFHHDKFVKNDLYSISQIKRKPEKKKVLRNISNKSNDRYYSSESSILEEKPQQSANKT